MAIDLRPLRDAVRKILNVIDAIGNELPESVTAGAGALRTALRRDEGVPE
jgi:p-aminobenzoyl-glutamate transporter AbgT